MAGEELKTLLVDQRRTAILNGIKKYEQIGLLQGKLLTKDMQATKDQVEAQQAYELVQAINDL